MSAPPAPAAPRFGEGGGGRGPGAGFGPSAGWAGAGLVAVLVALLVWSALAGTATAARHPRILGGSIVLDDVRPLVVLDLATGDVTVRLQDVFAEVGAPTYADVQAVALDDGTLLVNRRTGEFNLLGKDNFVLKRTGGGVGLGPLAGTTGAVGVADGSSGFIVRRGPHPTVSLVGSDTVQAAADLTSPGAAKVVPPRGFAALAGSVAGGPGALAVAGGDLFAALDGPTGVQIVQLRPGAPGSTLVTERRGVVAPAPAPIALEGAPGVMAVATPGHVRLLAVAGPAGAHRDVPVAGTAQATAILPVSGGGGRAWFVADQATGWTLFGVGADGALSGPHPLVGIPAGAALVRPVLSGGRLFTMDRPARGQPTLWQIDPATGAVQTVPGAPTYPQKTRSEKADFAAAEVVGSPGRVIFDNPDSLLGVVVFTDHRQAPVIFDKGTAVTVSANGPTTVNGPPSRSPGGSSNPQGTGANPGPPAAPLVNSQLTCANTAQKPRVPRISSLVPSAHGVTVSWTYPLLDEQDCEPQTWSVTVQAVHGPQPAQPTRFESGQLQYQFSPGLRPATAYQAVVTAYIGNQSTPSAPAGFTTAATGPDAPASVRTVADGNGDWVVSWTPCLGAGCYVPAATWEVTGAACDQGFVGRPPSVEVSGDQTSVTIPAAPAGLLGASLSFRVQGVSAGGLTGDATSDHSCVEAWRPPDRSHISVKASAVASGSGVIATVQVTTDEDPVDAFGSSSTAFTYHVGSVTVGPTAEFAVSIPGLAAGTSYTPTVVVAPAGHPGAAVTVTGAPFSQTLAWPSDLAVLAAGTVDPSNANSGTVVATFVNAPGVPLAASGQVICSSESHPFSGDLDAQHQLPVTLDLATMGGNCSLTATLSETVTRQYGVPSQNVDTNFSIGTQVDQSTFSANYSQQGIGGLVPTVVVNGDPQGKGVNWTVQISNHLTCNSQVQSSSGAPSFPLTFYLCGPLGSPVTVHITYTYLGTTVSFDVTPSGSPPSPPTSPPTSPPPSPPSSNPITTTTTAPGSASTAGVVGLLAVALGGRRRRSKP